LPRSYEYPVDAIRNPSEYLFDERFGVYTCRGSPSKVLPEDRLGDTGLGTGIRSIVYLLLRVLIYAVLRVLPNVLGLIVDGVLKVILVVGVVCRYLDYPSTSFDSSDLLS